MTDPGFGIYIHWPFCASKCPYCDFNSHVRSGIDLGRYGAALRTELATLAARHDRATVTSIFFGGGTPSLMPPEVAAALIADVHRLFPVDPTVEITLEANPTSVEAERFASFAEAGINRVSIGLQALDDEALRFLGRTHSAAEALRAWDVARARFARVSVDLIYARPDQAADGWAAELSRVLERAPDHLSLYQLTIEEGTFFARLAREGLLTGLDDERSIALFRETRRACRAQGLVPYEVSNFARAGAECRHNLTYWRYGPYVGVGPGAHGRPSAGGTRYATSARRMPEVWLAEVEAWGQGIETREALSSAVMADEMLLMGLRLTEGLSLSRHVALAGRRIDEARMTSLATAGLVRRDGDRLAATDAGIEVLDAVIATLA